MSQREAFEAYWAKSGMTKFKETAEASWQAAISYARGAAATACDGERVENLSDEDAAYNMACTDCVRAIKEALK